MIISPERSDFSTIFNILGKLLLALAGFMLLPLAVAWGHGEISPFWDFLLSFFLAASAGLALVILFPLREEISWIHAFFTVSMGWLVFSLFGAVPLYLSGHFLCFLDAWFESMSGFATTGLVLIQDLDHLSYAHNMWRHLTMFIGGQGIILASLSILTKARPVAVGFYMGEGRQEKILPNVIGTARFIWKVSFVYLLLGVTVFSAILMGKGLDPLKAVYHGLWLFFAAFDTGGFAPQAQNIAYYHSPVLEAATVVFMMLGAFNFNLHFWVWLKNKREIYRNFEVRIFLLTLFSLAALLYFSLKGMSNLGLFRTGFYQLISAHTGCGFTNVSSAELPLFPSLGLIAVIFAMMIGGGVCSTTGAIKIMRVGIILKSLLSEIKRWMMPFKSVYRDRIHHLQDVILSDKRVREAYVYFSLFLMSYIGGAVVGVMNGYPLVLSLFESVSAAANVGLSVGITAPSMPAVMKVVYILQMWTGRLEFLSIFVAIGFLVSYFKR
ncbi:MAG: TrkH family potassium uptake protein [Candidatus Omnitrophica bacterium]|nr:TrkH family potassium uptake protein [Candidatus Omnitrophota bacterium]